MTTESIAATQVGLFNGRLGRQHFLISWLLAVLVFGGANAAVFALGIGLGGAWAWLFLPLAALWVFFAVISVSTTIRRLHDFGQTGLWLLVFIAISIVPFLGLLAQIALLFIEGDAGANRYGPSPAGAKFTVSHAWFGKEPVRKEPASAS